MLGVLKFLANLSGLCVRKFIELPLRYFEIGIVNDDGFLSYYYQGQKYYVPVITSRGPVKFFSVCEGSEDVTMKLIPFAGPKRDFYCRTLTPSDLGYEELTFFTPSGRLTFGARDPIKL